MWRSSRAPYVFFSNEHIVCERCLRSSATVCGRGCALQFLGVDGIPVLEQLTLLEALARFERSACPQSGYSLLLEAEWYRIHLPECPQRPRPPLPPSEDIDRYLCELFNGYAVPKCWFCVQNYIMRHFVCEDCVPRVPDGLFSSGEWFPAFAWDRWME